jgi:arsenite methyltransferase
MSTGEIQVDVEVLREEIRRTYTDVSTEQERDYILPTGRAWARELGYPEAELAQVPDDSAESFAGVANHWTLGVIEPGAVVLDLGCGAGTDLLIAAQMTGAGGRAIGVDMTPAMLDRARTSARTIGLENVHLHEALIESLPLEDASVDVVISNGVIDLVPDKDAVFAEIDRVLRPGGRLQIADVVIHHEGPMTPASASTSGQAESRARCSGGSTRACSWSGPTPTSSRARSSTRTRAPSSRTRAARRRSSAPWARRSERPSRCADHR